jgi:PTS system mannose-specific IID component
VKPELKTLMRCFVRTYFIGAAFNTRGLQNIGLAYAMEPGLKAFYTDEKELKKARKRHLALYNTHPYWTPLLVGYFLFLEAKTARGLLAPSSLNKVKSTAAYTLSAIGDSFFGGSLLVCWSLIATLLSLTLSAWAGLAWLGVSLVCLQVFKLSTFWLGWRQGLTFFEKLRRLNLINWGQRIKYVNAGLLLGLWLVMYPQELRVVPFFLSSALIGAASLAVLHRFVPRELVLALAAAGLCLWAWMGGGLGIV